MSDVKLSKDYNPWISLWKGLQPLLVTAVVGALTTYVQNLDVATAVSLGLPVGIAAFLVPALKNFLKNRNN